MLFGATIVAVRGLKRVARSDDVSSKHPLPTGAVGAGAGARVLGDGRIQDSSRGAPQARGGGQPASAGRGPATAPRERVPIPQLVTYFLRLGALGFGGPVALCGLMERQLVEEKSWLSRAEMRDAIAVSQSLPGPLAIQVG